MNDAHSEGPAAAPAPSAVQPPSKDGADMDAAVEETDPQPKKITVRGLEFELPAKQPFRAMYEARRIVRAQKEGDKHSAVAAMMDVVAEYLGPEQMHQFLALELDAHEGAEACGEVLLAIDKVYGSAEGEASAS